MITVEYPTSTRLLIVRVWFEGDPPTELRARLVEVADSSPPDEVIATVATLEDLLGSFRAWVEGLTPR
jgi:hypothetical protein